MEDIEKRSHINKAHHFNNTHPDMIDVLRLLTYNHSEEEYDFDGSYWSTIYLDKPRSEEEIKEEIKHKFLAMIRENQSLSK